MAKTTEAIRVLIIDDDQDDFIIMRDYFQQIDPHRFIIEWCYEYNQAVTSIIKRKYHIYFVDYLLGVKTGLDLLRDAYARDCEEPIIFLTGFGNPDVDNEAMRIGATDYLIKSELSTEKLERCIRYALERSAVIKALRANEQKYKNIFERSKDAVFITDAELNFKDINQATSQLLGFDREDLMELTLYDLFEREDIKTKIKDGLKTHKEVVDLEAEVLDKNRETKYCLLTASTQYNTHGEEYVQAILHDITNLKKAERATLYAEKMASAGRLVRTLAHEVRNPLNNVQMAVEQLKTAFVNEDDKIFVEIIQRNGTRIDNLIDQLLDSYKPYEKILVPTTLQSVLEETVQIASDRTQLKGIEIVSAYPETPCLIQADKEKLKIAFLNLLVNATEAITEKSGKVEVSLSEKNGYYVAQITDNGCGIPPEILSKLFEPYFTSKRNGVGLGLASTLNIVQAHGGTVDVKSEVNVGSTFIVSFPKVQQQQSFYPENLPKSESQVHSESFRV